MLSTREFLQARNVFHGQRVAVYGRVTESVCGMGGIDYCILDGVVRCDLPNGVRVSTGRCVTITGTVVGNANASSDLVECAQPF
jgi:hypothetical protein